MERNNPTSDSPRVADAEAAITPEAPTVVLGEGETSADDAAPNAGRPGVGDVVGGRYRLTELIGEGGMSRVYKAVDVQRTQTSVAPVAIKVLSRPFAADDADFARLQAEFERLRTLAHPNIGRVLTCGREHTTVFIVMQWLSGRSLYDRLHSRAPVAGAPAGLDRDDAGSIIAAVGDAVEYAHSQGIVHGDLKPGNVIITAAGEIKVIDFRLAHLDARPKTALERREAGQRQLSAALTPRYASPQLLARHTPEITDDVFALACLTYEVLTGSHPFHDGKGSQTLRFPLPQRAGLTRIQHEAITRALQFDQRSRTPTVRQFLKELDAAPSQASWKKASWGWSTAAAVLLGAMAWFYFHGSSHRTSVSSVPVSAAPGATSAELPALPGAELRPLPPAGAITMAAPGSVHSDCPTCPQVTVIAAGHFLQGAERAQGAATVELPRHAVVIAYSVAIGTHDVTVGEFREFVTATGRDMRGCDVYDGAWRPQTRASWQDPGFPQTDAHPVTCTSWNDAVAYAAWLSAQTAHHYRLPTASEWEYAARAGSATVHPWSSEPQSACANANVADRSAARRYPGWDVFPCDDGYVNTAPGGTYRANAFGLVDMLGNVFQWTQDCWHGDYNGAPVDGAARLDGNCDEHELRGGSWFSAPVFVRPAARNHFAATYRTSSVGFRLVRDGSP